MSADVGGKHLDPVRKGSNSVRRASVRAPATAAAATTAARIATIAVALFDQSGKLVDCSARWKLIAPRGTTKKLRASVTSARDSQLVQQLRVPGRAGATLLVRVEGASSGLFFAAATEEAVTWPVDDDRTHGRLRQRERLRVLGELAAAVAHDLSSTLRSVRYLLSSVQADETVVQRCGETLSAMARGIDDSSNVIRRLHDFARNATQPSQIVSVKSAVDEAVKLLELEARGRPLPHIKSNVARAAVVRVSRGDLVHVVLNLLRNARDACARRKGKSEISIVCRKASGMVRIAVRDNGVGIAPVASAHLFEPFFTTKGVKGTGLGLFICASLAERMGGSVRAANGARAGAVFTVELPSVRAE